MKWDYVIDVKDLWKKGNNREIGVNEFVEELLKILRRKRFNSQDNELQQEYNILLEDLEDSIFDTYDDFDCWLRCFFNFCDYYKIWLRQV